MGIADVIVGAWLNDAGSPNAGRAYVYYGGPGADSVADLTLTGAAANDSFGAAVSGAGDVNGDGHADVIVGAIYNDAGGFDAGRAYVYYGGSGADAVADLTLTGAATGDYFGLRLSKAGDVNGDGYADVIVGAYSNDAGGANAGRAYVYYGGPGADAVADLTLTGAVANDQFGVSVSGAGDVDGNGFADVIVGASGNDAGGTNAGSAYRLRLQPLLRNRAQRWRDVERGGDEDRVVARGGACECVAVRRRWELLLPPGERRGRLVVERGVDPSAAHADSVRDVPDNSVESRDRWERQE